jgi:hypothetical protein
MAVEVSCRQADAIAGRRQNSGQWDALWDAELSGHTGRR